MGIDDLECGEKSSVESEGVSMSAHLYQLVAVKQRKEEASDLRANRCDNRKTDIRMFEA